jgi:Ca2+/H+ antiporter
LTEQVAEHTNGTIGALLNATFGNAPELLISISALRSGFYRVVQLAMLGSILTNMMLVFGVACLVGGFRWQVQVLRLTSGNVSVVMLLVSTAGFLFPAALLLSGQFNSYDQHKTSYELEDYVPSQVEISFGRVNAAVMLILYLLFLLFTLGTHQSEFESETLQDHCERRAQRNLFCLRRLQSVRDGVGSGFLRRRQRSGAAAFDSVPMLELLSTGGGGGPKLKTSTRGDSESSVSSSDGDMLGDGVAGASDGTGAVPAGANHDSADSRPGLLKRSLSPADGRSSSEIAEEGLARVSFGSDTSTAVRRGDGRIGGRLPQQSSSSLSSTLQALTPPASPVTSLRMKNYTDHLLGPTPSWPEESLDLDTSMRSNRSPSISMLAGILWLFVLTLCISALSDIIVDTIDGFAQRMNLSQVFTSMVIVPFFSNVAEQVSAFLFAYRNEMDLVVGVTIGSAIQIASFVLPGSVLIGMVMDRSMTLYFRAYETVCMLFGVIVVGAVLQGGTTNWLVGAGTFFDI